MPNSGVGIACLQGAYSEEVDSPEDDCTGGASEVSAVSVTAPSRSDTLSGEIPSLFIRVMKVVRLRPRARSSATWPSHAAIRLL